MKHAWTVWCRSLGEKTGNSDLDADRVAMIRTVIVLVNFATCLFIMANTVRHW